MTILYCWIAALVGFLFGTAWRSFFRDKEMLDLLEKQQEYIVKLHEAETKLRKRES